MLLRFNEKAVNKVESTSDEDQTHLLTDVAPDPITPLLTRKVIEEEIHTVKRTTTISEFAPAESPEMPTRRRVNRGFSSPHKHGQHTAAAFTTPLRGEKFHAVPGTQGAPQFPSAGNKGKYIRTPPPAATQHTSFSSP